MSDNSSVAVAPHDHSLSTDSEESFLIKHLNKSQLFNNSFSNQSSSSSSASKNRRSFFRESYIDETGLNRSFSIFQDAIQENSENSIDLAGLSSLDAEKLREATSRNVSTTALTNIENHSHSNTSPSDKVPMSRSNSRGYYSRQNRSRRSISRPSESRSQRSSLHDVMPQDIVSSEGENNAQSPNKISPLPTTRRTKTPEIPLPQLPLTNTPEPANVTPQVRAVIDVNRDEKVNAPVISDCLNENSITANATALGSSLQKTKPQGNPSQQQPPRSLSPPDLEKILSTINEVKTPKKMKSQTSIVSATKSDVSSKCKESILSLEQSRKTHKGTPHLLMRRGERLSPVDGIAEDKEKPYQLIISDIPSEDDFSTGLKPQDEMRMSKAEMVVKTVQLKELKSLDPFKDNRLVLDKLRRDEKKLSEQERKQGIRLPSTGSSSSEDSEFHRDIHYNDQMLEKIHYHRGKSSFYDNRDTREKSDRAGWLLYLISFLIPPLFFFLGLGLLDPYVPDRYISTQIKRTSLYTGIFVCVLALALTALGFAYGIRHVQR